MLTLPFVAANLRSGRWMGQTKNGSLASESGSEMVNIVAVLAEKGPPLPADGEAMPDLGLELTSF